MNHSKSYKIILKPKTGASLSLVTLVIFINMGASKMSKMVKYVPQQIPIKIESTMTTDNREAENYRKEQYKNEILINGRKEHD